MKTKIRPMTVLGSVTVVALLATVVRALAAGPSYQPRPKDVASVTREVKPPSGAVDERMPLPAGHLIGGSGIVEPAQREARLAGGSPGVILKITVKEGDHVREGDLLLALESSIEATSVTSAEADVASARANLARTQNGQRVEDRDAAQAEAASAKARADLSTSSFTRATQLFHGGAMTQEELDRARLTADADRETARASGARARAAIGGSRSEDITAARAALAAAEARLAQAKAILDRRQIRAPYAGEVLQVKARVGEYYTPGASEAPVVLGDTSRLRARMDVDERDIAKIAIGQAAYVIVDSYPGVKFPGKVAEIARRMGRKNVRTDDPTERLDTKILEVVIDLEETSRLVPGLRLTSYIDSGN